MARKSKTEGWTKVKSSFNILPFTVEYKFFGKTQYFRKLPKKDQGLAAFRARKKE